jgi:hypothetical protein
VAPSPDRLEKAWSGAKRRALDTLTADIEAEIVARPARRLLSRKTNYDCLIKSELTQRMREANDESPSSRIESIGTPSLFTFDGHGTVSFNQTVVSLAGPAFTGTGELTSVPFALGGNTTAVGSYGRIRRTGHGDIDEPCHDYSSREASPHVVCFWHRAGTFCLPD